MSEICPVQEQSEIPPSGEMSMESGAGNLGERPALQSTPESAGTNTQAETSTQLSDREGSPGNLAATADSGIQTPRDSGVPIPADSTPADSGSGTRPDAGTPPISQEAPASQKSSTEQPADASRSTRDSATSKAEERVSKLEKSAPEGGQTLVKDQHGNLHLVDRTVPGETRTENVQTGQRDQVVRFQDDVVKVDQPQGKDSKEKTSESSEKGSQPHADLASSAERADISADKESAAHPSAELAKGIVESAETGLKAAEVLTKGKVVTGIERSLAAASRGTGRAADTLASKAPDQVARTIYRVSDKLQSPLWKPAGQRVRDIAEKTGFRVASGGIEGVRAGLKAHERGVGSVATALDAAAVGGIAATSFGRPIDKAINVAHEVVNAISPEAGKYTGVAASATPSDMAKNLAVGTIDTLVAIGKGDSNQLIQHHEQNLQGEYGEAIRGYAIAAEALGAYITGGTQALFQLGDKAASGALGMPAKLGDYIGGKVYDLTH